MLMSLADSSGALQIEFSDVRTCDGSLYLFVYNYENQYPDNPYRHYRFDKATITDGKGRFEIEDLDYGHYAIAVFDDENDNQDMDKFIGLPTEGYGFSRNAKPRFLSLPDFHDLVFEFGPEESTEFIKVRYVF